MAGLYQRMIDPNMVAPGRAGTGANAGIGAPGAGALPRQQDDNFDAAQLSGLLGMLAKKNAAESAAPGAAVPGTEGAAPQTPPGMVPMGNQGNFDMAPAQAGMMPNGGNFQLPPQGSGDAFQIGNVGAQSVGPQGAPLMSNFGSGVPQAPANPVAGMQMPASIGGAGIPQLGGLDPSLLQALQPYGMLGMMGGMGGAG